ncbi:MAG: tripartite tricarboxylate transporter substrate-binding protein [Xanthobacteraceae bacterium]
MPKPTTRAANPKRTPWRMTSPLASPKPDGSGDPLVDCPAVRVTAVRVDATQASGNDCARGRFRRFVPYRAGSSNVMRDLVAGHIDLTFDQAISALPYVRNGQVRAYAITAKSRIASAPDIPKNIGTVRRQRSA